MSTSGTQNYGNNTTPIYEHLRHAELRQQHYPHLRAPSARGATATTLPNFIDVREINEEGTLGYESQDSTSSMEFTISSPRGQTTFFSFTFREAYNGNDCQSLWWTFCAKTVPNIAAGIRSLLHVPKGRWCASSFVQGLDIYMYSTQEAKPGAHTRKARTTAATERRKQG